MRPTRRSALVARSTPVLRLQHRDPVTPFPATETAILSAAIAHVPSHGFSKQALLRGAQDVGYLPASLNLFPHGAFDLVRFHLVTQRLALKHNVQFPAAGSSSTREGRTLGVGAKARSLLLARLRANTEFAHRYSEAIALMSLASNIPASLAELARLSDEIWYLAGDTAVDTSWYTKRGLLAGVYASAEVFMTQDTSKDFADTEHFLDRRLEDVRVLGQSTASVGQWVGFTGQSTVNILRSWGVRL